MFFLARPLTFSPETFSPFTFLRTKKIHSQRLSRWWEFHDLNQFVLTVVKNNKKKTLSLIKQTYPITAFHLRARVIKKRLSHRSKSGVPTWGNPLSRSLPSSRALKVTQGALRSLTLTHQPRGSDWWSEELSLVFLSQSRPSSSVERVASDHCVCLDLNVCVWLTSWSAFLVLSWSFSAENPRFIF